MERPGNLRSGNPEFGSGWVRCLHQSSFDGELLTMPLSFSWAEPLKPRQKTASPPE